MRSDRGDSYPGMATTRGRLLVSLVGFGLVLLLAAVRQSVREPATKSVEPPATERTVFGAPPSSPVLEPAATKPEIKTPEIKTLATDEGTRARRAAPPLSTTPRHPVAANLPGDLNTFLHRWRSTLISGDASAQAELYAPRVERFFTKRNVSRNDVRREKERLIAEYPEFYRYDIGDIRVESMDNNRAVVTFRKDWDARGRGRFAGSERQRLTLTREAGSWKIIGEEETKVYWVKRS